jgi:hypothetical protein
MVRPELYAFCNEFYFVEKTVDAFVALRGQTRHFRIEALRDSGSNNYSTRVYIEEDFTLQPTYPAGGGDEPANPRTATLWVEWRDFPWTHRNSADEAIEQGLSFLEEHSRK